MTVFSTKKTVYDIERLISDNKSIQLSPTGYSMYPMFVPGRDEAIISPIAEQRLKRGDVVLYRRDKSILVLHRICRINQKGIYLVGDNQVEVEGPLRPDQIKGILTSFIRKGKTISVRNPIYLLFTHIWLFLRPIRRLFQLIAATLKQLKNH